MSDDQNKNKSDAKKFSTQQIQPAKDISCRIEHAAPKKKGK